jgi:hypothetical protein
MPVFGNIFRDNARARTLLSQPLNPATVFRVEPSHLVGDLNTRLHFWTCSASVM